MRVAIAHISLNSAGGGELVCLSLMEKLRRDGNEVVLVTVDRTDWNYLKKIFGVTSFPSRELYLFSGFPRTHFNTLHSALLLTFYFMELVFLRLAKKGDILITTCGEKVNSVADVVYVNGIPLRSFFTLSNIDAKRKCYSRLYDTFLRLIDRVNKSTIIANSKFTKQIMGNRLKEKTLVIYPPVNLQRFSPLAQNKKRQNTIIAVSRFLPEQNVEYIPQLAKLISNANFLIIGPSGKTSKTTLQKLHRMITELKVEEKVEILTNEPLPKLLESLSASKIFLRTLPHEPFGISVVEAMASGCVPIVPREGGPWVDILEEKQGEYGYSYQGIKEAADIIKMLLQNERLREEISVRARTRTTEFDGTIFENRMANLVKKVYLSRQHIYE